MASRTITIELTADYGHPSNRLTKEYLFKEFSKQLPKALEHTDFANYEITSLKVE